MQNAMLESVFSARICRICNEDIIRKADNATEIVTANALKLNEFNELPTERSISQSSAQVPSSTPTLSSMQSFSADSDVDLIAQQWKEVCRALFKHQKIRKALEQAEDLFAPYSDAQMALKAERNNIDRQIQVCFFVLFSVVSDFSTHIHLV